MVKGKAGPKPGPVTRGKKPKASAPPAAADVVGHNNPPEEMTEDQKRALAFQHADKIEKQAAVVATAVSEMRRLYKVGKADGFPKARLDRIISLRKDGGEERLKAEIAADLEIARWLAMPIGTTVDMFDMSAPDRTPAVDKAFELGKISGMRAERPEPPYPANSPTGQGWMRGYHAGQEVNQQNLANMNRPKQVAEHEFEPAANDDGGEPPEPEALH